MVCFGLQKLVSTGGFLLTRTNYTNANFCMEKHHCVFFPVPVVDPEIEQDTLGQSFLLP